MRLFYSIEVLCISVLMSFPVLVQAQEWHPYTAQQIDSIVNPPLLKEAASIVQFDSIVTNIGQMTEDDSSVYVDFTFRNTGKEPLVVTRIRTDCGCTDGQIDKLKYLPGERGVLTIKYTPENHPGSIDASSFVYSSLSDVNPIAKVTLLGNVLPGKDVWDRYRYSIGVLKLKQKKVVFQFEGQQRLTERILCGNSGRTPIELKVLNQPEYVEVRTEPSVIQPGDEADIVICVDSYKIKASGKHEIPLQIEGIPEQKKGEIIKLEINLNKIN